MNKDLKSTIKAHNVILCVLKDKKPKTNASLVLDLLESSEEALVHAEARIQTLEEDLSAFHHDIEEIKKYVKIELSASNDQYKIVLYKDPNNDWNTEILAWSDKLDEEHFSDSFKFLMKLFHLELPDVDSK